LPNDKCALIALWCLRNYSTTLVCLVGLAEQGHCNRRHLHGGDDILPELTSEPRASALYESAA